MARRLLYASDVRSLYLLLALVTGCSFDPLELGVQPDAQPGDNDAAPLSTADAAQPTQLAGCHSQLPGIVLCLDFEGSSLDPTVLDSSGEGHDGSAADVVAISRGSQQAASVTTASSIVVPASPEFDLASALSIELWFDPAQTSEDNTIVSHGNDFGIDFDHSTGCYTNNDEVWAPNDLAPGWHHIACTYDGKTLAAYVDGAIVACKSTSSSTVASKSILISDHVVGGIDDVHVYDRALVPLEVQLMAGVVSPYVSCPGASSPAGG